MRHRKVIKECFNAYDKAVKEACEKDYNEYPLEKLSHGVCLYLFETKEISRYEDNIYWINRNLAPHGAYWCDISRRGIKYLKYRRDILEIEYKHHKKWWILARFIKPPSHKELYNNLITE